MLNVVPRGEAQNLPRHRKKLVVAICAIRVAFYPELDMPRPADDSRPVRPARGPVTVARASGDYAAALAQP